MPIFKNNIKPENSVMKNNKTIHKYILNANAV